MLGTVDTELFFPCYRIKKKQSRASQDEYVERPVVPGYVFVHAPLGEALDLGKELNMVLWRKSSNVLASEMADDDTDLATLCNRTDDERRKSLERMYYSIPDSSMRRFMQAVTFYQNEIELFDASDIDVKQDDEVEFIDGPMKGLRGYVRTEERRSGGIVIIPMASGDADECDNVNLRLHYGIHAKPREYRIVKFASNDRSSRSLKKANVRARAVLHAYGKGEELNEKDLKKLKAYVLRYADVEVETLTQKINLMLLLYRIYTVLEVRNRIAGLEKRIKDELMPCFDNQITRARGKNKVDAEKKKAGFEKEIAHIKSVWKDRMHDLNNPKGDKI